MGINEMMWLSAVATVQIVEKKTRLLLLLYVMHKQQLSSSHMLFKAYIQASDRQSYTYKSQTFFLSLSNFFHSAETKRKQEKRSFDTSLAPAPSDEIFICPRLVTLSYNMDGIIYAKRLETLWAIYGHTLDLTSFGDLYNLNEFRNKTVARQNQVLFF